jgi:hypothetical protein
MLAWPRKPRKKMGTPIKDRGIRWKETYADKSAYLKREFEEQVGPGSYFRWEGHDHVSGSDYYVVVSPGFSKKHGYHFFAGLRKIPAEAGASGKKFKTQAEALSYAIDKWRVPPPETKPHKAYVDRDLHGKPIVLENVHASSSPIIVRTSSQKGSTMIIIDTTSSAPAEKRAMSLPVSGRFGDVFRSTGPRSLPSRYQYAAKAMATMGRGAALYMLWELGLADKMNQGEGTFMDETVSEHSSQMVPMLATVEAPHSDRFNEHVQRGLSERSKLYKIDKRKGTVEFREPAYPESNKEQGYNIITFGDVHVLRPSVKIGWKKRAQFDNVMRALTTDPEPVVDSAGQHLSDNEGKPLFGVPMTSGGRPVLDDAGNPQYIRGADGQLITKLSSRFFKDGEVASGISRVSVSSPAQGRRENHFAQASVPIDLFRDFERAMSGVASIEKMPFAAENAIELFDHFERSGKLSTPEEFQAVMGTPVFEEITQRGGQMVVYDERMWPLGIKISRDQHIEQEGFSEGGTKEEVQYDFADGVVERLLASPEVGGDLGRLRAALSKNQIQLTHDMFVDSRTCSPLLHPIRSVMPRVDDNYIPETDEQGRIRMERRDLIPEYSIHADKLKARVFDPATGMQKITAIPEGTVPQQTFSGAQALSKDTKMYIPVQRRNPDTGEMEESFHPVEVGEWKHSDTRSRGKFIPGNIYTLMIKPANASSKKSDLKRIHKLGQEREGFFMGYKETYAWKRFKKGMPSERHRSIVTDVVLKNGQVLRYPPDANPEDPAVRALAAPADIEGYYYVTQRQHPGKPLTTAKPTAEKPIEIEQYERLPDGSVAIKTDPNTGQPVAPLRLTIEDAFGTAVEGKKSPTYMRTMNACVKYLKARFGFNDYQIGRWTNAHADDLKIIDDKYIETDEKIKLVREGRIPESALDEHERMLAGFREGSDFVPAEFLRHISQTDVSNPEDFAPKTGTIFGVREVGGEWVSEEMFGTRWQAEEFRQNIILSPDYANKDIEVAVMAEDAPLVVSAQRRAAAGGPAEPLTHNTEISEAVTTLRELAPGEEVADAPEAAFEEDEDHPEGQHAPEAPPIAAEAPAEQSPIATVPSAEPGAPVADAQPAEQFPWAGGWGSPIPQIPDEPQTIVQAPVTPQKKKPGPPAETEAAMIQRLVKLANRLDEQGRAKEADAVDKLIKVTLARRQPENK